MKYLNTSTDGFPPLDPKNGEWDSVAGRSVVVLAWLPAFDGDGKEPVLARYLYSIQLWRIGVNNYAAHTITKYVILEEPE